MNIIKHQLQKQLAYWYIGVLVSRKVQYGAGQHLCQKIRVVQYNFKCKCHIYKYCTTPIFVTNGVQESKR